MIHYLMFGVWMSLGFCSWIRLKDPAVAKNHEGSALHTLKIHALLNNLKHMCGYIYIYPSILNMWSTSHIQQKLLRGLARCLYICPVHNATGHPGAIAAPKQPNRLKSLKSSPMQTPNASSHQNTRRQSPKTPETIANNLLPKTVEA